MQIEIPSFKDHAIADVNGSFARVKCSCASFEVPATPSNGPNIAVVLAVDDRTVAFA
jgi:hypothetical protein